MALPTLLNTHSPLADAATQRATLDALPLARDVRARRLAAAGHAPLRATGISVLQINVGKRCNQTCRHCHVDAGPDRTEVMPPDVVDACLRFLDASDIPTRRHHRRRARAAPALPRHRRARARRWAAT